ncbi:adenosine deaminase [Actinopolymorpha sp. NPDC004070]|uniref:adenosine deaminase n=1 Tax=Actinopolymorpha sp. NPDC004070 TaxID=3154548 RepID=UPI0033B161D0
MSTTSEPVRPAASSAASSTDAPAAAANAHPAVPVPDAVPRRYEAFIAGLPKAELHVHHVGSASPRIVAELAARHPKAGVPADPAKLAEYFTFTDFAHFITVYLSVVDLVRDAEDVRTLTYGVAENMHAQGIRYAELTVTPYSHIHRGIPGEAFMDAIEDARLAAERDLGLVLRWCFDISGESGIPAADVTLDAATRLAPAGLVSFGLGGPEIGVGRPQFKPHFDAARATGLHSVPHAGETTGPETIWDALNVLGAERIGHGTSATRDPELLAHLAEKQIPLEVCPTSNIATRAVATLAEHPLADMVAAGCLVTVNSDDPPMFATDLNTEYAVAADLLDLDESGIAALAKNAVTTSFAPEDVKARLTAEIDGYLTSWTSR